MSKTKSMARAAYDRGHKSMTAFLQGKTIRQADAQFDEFMAHTFPRVVMGTAVKSSLLQARDGRCKTVGMNQKLAGAAEGVVAAIVDYFELGNSPSDKVHEGYDIDAVPLQIEVKARILRMKERFISSITATQYDRAGTATGANVVATLAIPHDAQADYAGAHFLAFDASQLAAFVSNTRSKTFSFSVTDSAEWADLGVLVKDSSLAGFVAALLQFRHEFDEL